MIPPTEKYISAEAVDRLSRLSWETLDYLSSILGRPTEGHIAWAIWRKSGLDGTAASAARAMVRMGYVSFQGYPLQLAGPRPHQMEAIHQALESAYAEIRDNDGAGDTGPNPVLLEEGACEALELARSKE